MKVCGIDGSRNTVNTEEGSKKEKGSVKSDEGESPQEYMYKAERQRDAREQMLRSSAMVRCYKVEQ